MRVSTACAAVAAALGVVLAVGSVTDVTALTGQFEDAPGTKINTAIALVVLAGAVALHARHRRRGLVVLAAAAVLALSAATLLEWILGVRLGIDELLLRDDISPQGLPPGRMAPSTCTALGLLAAGVLLDGASWRGRRVATGLLAAAAALAILGLIGLIGGSTSIDGAVGATRMAAATIAGVLLLAAGKLASRPDATAMRLLTSPAPGGVLLRRLLPPAIGVPLFFDAVREALRATGAVDDRAADWLFAFSVLIVFTAVVVRLSSMLDDADAERRDSEARLRDSEAFARSITATAHDGVLTCDGEGIVTSFNEAAERMFGRPAADVVGQSVRVLMPERDHDGHLARVADLARNGAAPLAGRAVEMRGVTATGREFDCELTISTFVNGGDVHVTLIMRDVTQRKHLEALLRLQAERLQQVVAAQSAIAAASDGVDDVLEIVAQHASKIVGGDGAIVELPDGDELVYRAAVGSAAPYRGIRVHRDASLSGLTLQSGHTHNCTDAETDPRVDRETCRRVGLRSMVCVPLRHEQATVGVLKVIAARPQAFSEPDERTLELLAGLAGDAVHRARSERRLAAHHAVARALAEADGLDSGLQAALRGLAAELDFEMGTVWLVPEAGDAAHPAATWHGARLPARPLLDETVGSVRRAGEGAVGRAWGDCVPTWEDDLASVAAAGNARAAAAVRAGLTTASSVPIVARGEALGALEVWARERRPHDADVVELLQLLGTQIGQFVQRKRAEARLALHATHLARVVDLTEEISRLRDPRAVRPTLARAIRAMTGADMTVLLEPDGDVLVVTAQAGDVVPDGYRIAFDDPSLSVAVFQEGRGRFVSDVAEADGVDRAIVERTGLRSVLFEPVSRDGEVGGVLAIGSRALRPQDQLELGTFARLLAAETGNALERADLVAALAASARTDQLTGVANRRAWDDELPRELARARRAHALVSVAMIDLDHFKSYNDTYGHPAGDRLLRAAAAGWAERLRTTDLLARYGGEEFAVLLPGCTPEAAAGVFEDLRSSLPDGVTCSIGVAAWDGAEDADAVVARADAALYRAKRDGRDRVVAAA